MWWFDVHEPLAGSPAAALAERFAGYGSLVSALLEKISNGDLEAFRHVTHRVPDQWGRGAATLLGDAAHAFPPTQAQGANQALEDAWLLSRALRAQPADLPGTLRRYERLRARRVRKVSRRAASERTNKPIPPAVRALTGLIPPSLIGQAYLAQLRGVSSILTGARFSRAVTVSRSAGLLAIGVSGALLVGLSGRAAVAEGDGEGVQRGFPAHRPSGPASSGGLRTGEQIAGHACRLGPHIDSA